MTKVRGSWNAWDVPYFGGKLRKAGPSVPSATAAPGPDGPGGRTLLLADGGRKIAERVLAVLIAIGGVLAGAILTGLLLIAHFILSWGSPASSSEVRVAIGFGAAVAIAGIALAVLTYREAGRPAYVRVEADRIEVAHRAFSPPFVVPRPLVRVAAIDDTPTRLFTNNKRFPIHGAVPPGSFADQLDNLPSGPWDDFDPDRYGPGRPSPAVIWEDMPGTGAMPGGYAHDDPERAGWAAAGRAPSVEHPPTDAHLWSAHGSSLPFLRVGPADVPNVAIIFHEPLKTPRTPWWLLLSPVHQGRIYVRGGRTVRGLLVRVRSTADAAGAFTEWGVLRPVTASDVVEEGLLVAKPLVGLRALAYGGVVLGSFLVELVIRHLR